MANEEMRRLKMGLQAIQEAQAQAVVNQQAAIAPAPTPSTPGETAKPEMVKYSWFVKAENYAAAEVKNGETVVFRGIRGVTVSNVNKTVTIAIPPVVWLLRGDSISNTQGSHSVQYGGVVNVRGINGVTTTVSPGTNVGTLTIDRPLTIQQRSVSIGGPDTVTIDFYNHQNHINKHQHEQIYFHVDDMGNGKRRVTGWTKTGGGSSSLEGALSTVWIKDATTDPALSVGYNILTGQYINQLFVGPWGWQSASGVTTPYAGSNYSNNAIDTQWDWGVSERFSVQSAYTRFGAVNEDGLYLISGTTQGIRYLTSAIYTSIGVPFINIRLHYYLAVRRLEGETYVTRIYKTLDVCPLDIWNFNTSGNVEDIYGFVIQMSTLPWSLQGTAQIWLNAGDEVSHLISYNFGNNGETRILFQVTYHAFEAIKIADSTTLDPATQVTLQPVNYLEGPANYHPMQFTNV
jgi:hypothetical protein